MSLAGAVGLFESQGAFTSLRVPEQSASVGLSVLTWPCFGQRSPIDHELKLGTDGVDFARVAVGHAGVYARGSHLSAAWSLYDDVSSR